MRLLSRTVVILFIILFISSLGGTLGLIASVALGVAILLHPKEAQSFLDKAAESELTIRIWTALKNTFWKSK